MERCDTVAAKRTGRQKGGRREEGLREGGGKERDLTRLRRRRSERDIGTED